eukprot:1176729-Prorocentrum_minimum.AAC.8
MEYGSVIIRQIARAAKTGVCNLKTAGLRGTPPELAQLTNMRMIVLNASYNQVARIAPQIALPELRMVNLAFNQLNSIPEELALGAPKEVAARLPKPIPSPPIPLPSSSAASPKKLLSRLPKCPQALAAPAAMAHPAVLAAGALVVPRCRDCNYAVLAAGAAVRGQQPHCQASRELCQAESDGLVHQRELLHRVAHGDLRGWHPKPFKPKTLQTLGEMGKVMHTPLKAGRCP